jgi:outer membrane immunogenic protein
MKKSLTIGVAAAAYLAVPAMAADLPAKAPVYAPAIVATPAYNWTGFYIGGNAGYGWAQSERTFLNANWWDTKAGDQVSLNPAGWLGGAQLGFNYQINQLVIGIEGAWDGANLKQTVVSPYAATDRDTNKILSLYTIDGRIGAVWDRLLVYGKGGWAGGQVELSAYNIGGVQSWHPGTQSRSGWILGVGLEYMMLANWIVGVEYNYIDLRTRNYTANDVGIVQLTNADDRTKVGTIVGRLSYKFNWGR